MINCPLVSKDVQVSWIRHAKLPLSVRGISGVTMWDYGVRSWVGLFYWCRLDGLNGHLLYCSDSMIFCSAENAGKSRQVW